MIMNPIFTFCMLLLPVFCVSFFTTMLNEGAPTNLPVGVVDMDNSATSRKLTRMLNGFQSTHVVAHYNNMNEAREAVQRGEIYAFLLFPKGMSQDMIANRQPTLSFYYNGVVMLAGSNTMKDLKTVCTLAGAGVGSAKLSALGKTSKEIQAFLQPIAIDLHQVGNPWLNYNVYLTTTMAAGLIMLFIFLITPYSIGTELKFGRARDWMRRADNNPMVAILGKFLPQTMIFLCVFLGFEFYVYHVLQFPHPGGYLPVIVLGLGAVLSAQCFGIFIFGLMPSLRMSMSICSLWAMLSFSLCGATFPVDAMDPMLQSVSWLFPLRHYYMIYQVNILHGFPMYYVWQHWLALAGFVVLPLFVLKSIKKAMLVYKYIP